MKFEEAFEIVDKAVRAEAGRHLNDVELMVLRGSCEGLTYDEMAQKSGYGVNYLKGDAGHKFWKLLSKALGEQVGKRNFQAALERAKGRFSVAGAESVQSAEALGTEKPDQDFYVERPPIEHNCCEEIKRPGALIRIKAPAKMGKTSLIGKILACADQQGYQTVLFNFLQAKEGSLKDLDNFLLWFCTNVGRRLQQDSNPEDYWNDSFSSTFSSNDKCTFYFEEHLLPKIDCPLVLALDNVDRVFEYPEEVRVNFFSLLRSWHEQAKNIEPWKKLRLVLAYSTEVYMPLNLNQSPFNVGLPTELPEFTTEQIKDLSKRRGLDWEEAKITKLMDMVGGHPYLVHKALIYMKNYPNAGLDNKLDKLDEFLQEAPTEAGLYDDVLREHLLILEQDKELAAAMKEVVDATEPVRLDWQKLFKLDSMGLLRLKENDVEPRCKLYRLYFQEHLKDI
ncbi:MAG: hypothetical protein F6J93_01865 [Oscillatoria sp. SIO1A7]|nr:hypothetical protein [Oscillatoria sp. SIO1A7]